MIQQKTMNRSKEFQLLFLKLTISENKQNWVSLLFYSLTARKFEFATKQKENNNAEANELSMQNFSPSYSKVNKTRQLQY